MTALQALKTKYQDIPPGAGTLFFIQIFSTLSFAVLYSTLVLYATKTLHFHINTATAIMGSFAAFNYGLHLLGGYLGGRFLSFRNIFVLGMLLQIIGCITLSAADKTHLYWGLSAFLVGSGLNVTCINMMLTQLFQPDDPRREQSFLWNYSGMNIGFLIGFFMAGYFQQAHDYHTLFMLAAAGNVITILITISHWPQLADVSTYLALNREKIWPRSLMALTVVFTLIPTLHWLLKHATISNELFMTLAPILAVSILILAFKQPTIDKRHKLIAYLILSLASLIFWSLYQMAPMGLTIFIENNVARDFLGYTIPTPFFLNVNTIVIILGGPLVASLFAWLRENGVNLTIPLQFAYALLFIGTGFAILPLGIKLANPEGYTSMHWIVTSYILQSVGELFISPIGYAMIGQLVPKNLQGLLMGAWMFLTGVAAVFSNYFSTFALNQAHHPNPLISNIGFSYTFNLLGWGAIIAGLVFLLFVPFICRLISQVDNTDSINSSKV